MKLSLHFLQGKKIPRQVSSCEPKIIPSFFAKRKIIPFLVRCVGGDAILFLVEWGDNRREG